MDAAQQVIPGNGEGVIPYQDFESQASGQDRSTARKLVKLGSARCQGAKLAKTSLSLMDR